MRKLTLAIVCAAALLGAAETPQETLFAQIEPTLRGLAEITGWKVRRKVPADRIDKAGLQKFVERRIHETIKPEQIRLETLGLKMFGFLPAEYNLEQAVVELMTEQAAAFYDYQRRKLFITETGSGFLEERAALVHELAHALADQAYPLGRYLHHGVRSDDAGTAREAVVEGQATWLMWAYVTKLGGGEARVPAYLIESMKDAAGASVGSQFPVYQNAPLYLRESLMFPYAEGLAFNNSVIEKLGKSGFDEVFRRPPASTQQILHPDLYVKRQQPTRPAAPPAPRGYRERDRGSIGELDFRILLEQYASKEVSREIAPHWRGGAYRLFEKQSSPLLTFAVEWDSPASAQRFFDEYVKLLAKKWKICAIRDRSATRAAGAGDRGEFEVTLTGALVTSREGFPSK